MKIVVLGATGPAGQQVVTEGLAKGHEVTAIVRSPDKMTIQNDKLKVIKGDLTVASDMTEHMKGQDAVLSAVGGKGGLMTPCDVYSTVGKATIEAMRAAEVKRYVAVTSWGTKDTPDLGFVAKYLAKPFLRNVLKDMALLEDYLINECSDINYTFVKPPRLVDGPSVGKDNPWEEGQMVHGCTKDEISRVDLAKFMLRCLESNEFDQKLIAVAASKKECQAACKDKK